MFKNFIKKKLDNSVLIIFILLIFIISAISSILFQKIYIYYLPMLIIIFSMLILVKPEKYIFIFIGLYPILPDYFRMSKFPVYSLMVVGLIFVCVYYYSHNKKYNILELSREKKYSTIFLLYIFIQLILYTVHFQLIILLKFILENVIVIWLIYSYLDSKKKFIKAIDILIISSLIICIFGIIEYVTRFNMFSLIENYYYPTSSFGSEAYIRLGQVRIEQSFNHAIIYCIYLMFSSSLVFYRMQYGRGRNKICLFILFLISVNAVLTMSRFPLILYVMNLIVLTMFLPREKRKKIISYGFFVGILTAVILYITEIKIDGLKQIWYMILAVFNEKYRDLISSEFVGDNSEPFDYRIKLYSAIFYMIKDNFLFGLPDGADKLFTYTSSTNVTITASSVDNNYLVILQNYGFIGLLNFILYYISNIIYSFRKIRSTPKDYYNFNIIFISTMIFYLINLLSVAQMHEIRMVLIFVTLMLSYNKIFNIKPQ